jgi:trk system potassium uptake protein TrkA
MFVAINGGGEVGSFLARTLFGKGHAVSVIDKRSEVMRKLAEEVPTDILLVEGDGCDIRALEDAGVDRADVFASVTPHDEENLVSCQLARLHFGVRRVVARVSSPRNEGAFHALGIDAISSTTVISQLIEEQLTVGDIIRLYTLQKGQLGIVEVEVQEGAAAADGRTVAELGLPDDIVLVSLTRGDRLLIPRGRTSLQPGDRVMAVTMAGREAELARLLRGTGATAHRRGRERAVS